MSEIIDLRWRIELRSTSPDSSVPTSGRLLAYASERIDDTWILHHRAGRLTLVAPDRTAALAQLEAWQRHAPEGAA